MSTYYERHRERLQQKGRDYMRLRRQTNPEAIRGNLAIGYLRDNPLTAHAAATYLEMR